MRRFFLVLVSGALFSLLLLISSFYSNYQFPGDPGLVLEALYMGKDIANTTATRQPSPQLLPHPHPNLHPRNLTLINIKNFRMPINQDICNISDIALVTIIHSAVPNFEARNVIRTTWGNPNIPGVNTRLVFLTGETDVPGDQAALVEEASVFHDVVQGGFHDSYHNLSYKNVFGKLWVSTFCEQAEFVVKTDDDMYIDLFATYAVTRQYLSHPQYLEDSFILCPVWRGMPILRDKDSKWYVSYEDISREEAPGNVYPEYCTGWIYILSTGTARRLVEQAKKTRFFWIDDAWVTGMLVRDLKFIHFDLMEYFSMQQNKMLIVKSFQHPKFYHKDLICAPMSRNYDVSFTLHKHAEWCYLNKCFNNVYHQHPNLTEYDKIFDKVLQNASPRD